MILHDRKLEELCNNGLVNPYTCGNLQGCSIDLTLADTIKVETTAGFDMAWKEQRIVEQSYLMDPGEMVLCCTNEILTLPTNVAAQVLLRSSAARAGYNHLMAGWADPGFHGTMVLELQNTLRHHRLELRAGMRLVQMVCFGLDEEVERDYALRGNYQGQRDVRESTMDFA